ncbi:conserved protein, unknown function, partial [Hepatocystis sp. ex Piliocolobus tephrosceles]
MLLSTTVGWNFNRLYHKNELNIQGLKNDHDLIVVRHVNISDEKENNNAHRNNNLYNLSEKDLLSFLQHFNDVNKKHKGFCETAVFKNSNFANTPNEHNNNHNFNTYLIIDKWKTKNNFEQSKKEFEILFSKKKEVYNNEKMQNIYFNYETYDNNYETVSTKNIFQKLFDFIF